MKRILIAEDEAAWRNQLKEYILRYAQIRGEEIRCSVFADGTDLLEDYRGGADLILLDIDMGQKDGIETAREIRRFDETVQIVFITRMVQHALEGYEVQAADYIIKPVAFDLFQAKMDRVFRKMDKAFDDRIILKTGSEQRYAAVREIVYFESAGKKITVHLSAFNGRPDGSGAAESFEVSGALYQLEKELSGRSFFRCHSAFLINLRFVTGYDQTDVFLGEERVPLSKHRRKAFIESLTVFHMNRM